MIDDETKEKLEYYIEAYEHVLKRVRIDQVAINLVQEMARDMRTGLIQQERRNHAHGSMQGQDVPATEKQRAFLERLGVSIPEPLSKHKASELIDEAQAKAAM